MIQCLNKSFILFAIVNVTSLFLTKDGKFEHFVNSMCHMVIEVFYGKAFSVLKVLSLKILLFLKVVS